MEAVINSRIKQKLAIIGPPLVLILIGVAVYIAVVKITTPEVEVITVVNDTSATESADFSANSSPSAQPLTTIQLDIPEPNLEQVENWQKAVDAGSEQWRTDPLEVAQQTAGQYGFLVNDQLTLVVQDANSQPSGEAMVLAVTGGKDYIITLHQPGTVGETGVWVITDIEES